jgi:hypothetical protein
MSDLLTSLAPRDPFGWIGWGVVLLGLAVLLVAAAVWLFTAQRRVRRDMRYSPVTGSRARWAAVGGIFVMILGAGILWFSVGLRAYDPFKPGEPVGLVTVVDKKVVFESAFDGRQESLGPFPGKPFAVVGDVLDFPGWTRLLGLRSHHRVRQIFPPRSVTDPIPPSDDLLFRLVGSKYFPGEARSYLSPAMTGRTRTALRLLPEGGYAAQPYPGRP